MYHISHSLGSLRYCRIYIINSRAWTGWTKVLYVTQTIDLVSRLLHLTTLPGCRF